MSIAIGYFAQNNDGNFAGFLMMGALDRLKGLSNFAKTPKSHSPDYHIFGGYLEEMAVRAEHGQYKLRRKNSFLTFEYPNISARKDYEILIQVVPKAQIK